MKKYKVIIECSTRDLAKKVGMLIVDKIPEIKKFLMVKKHKYDGVVVKGEEND